MNPNEPGSEAESGAVPSTTETSVDAVVDAAAVDAPAEPPTDACAPSAEAIAAPEATAPALPDAPADVPAAAPPKPAASPNEIAQRLKSLFPALFTGAPKPIKLRVQQDIQERAPGQFTKQELSIFFRRFTRSTSYLHALSRATQRFDLDGQPAGEVSEEHRTAAAEEARLRRSGQDERRELEEQQRRNRAGLLHDFEITTLTVPNFCALKGVVPEELDGLLDIARREREERPPERYFDQQRPSGGPGRPADRAPSDRPRGPRGPRPQGRPDRADGPGPGSAPQGQRRR